MNSPTKKQITTKVMEQLPENLRMFTADEYMKRWWQTGSNGTTLRLSEMGDTMFRIAEIEYFDLPLEVKQANWHKFILDCSKKIKCPYYIGVNKNGNKKEAFIRIYDSKIAMLTTLYGSIQEYLDSVKIRPF